MFATENAESLERSKVADPIAVNSCMECRLPSDGLTEELPVLALREFVVFPYMVLPLFVSRERSIAAVEEAMAGDRRMLLVAQRNSETSDPDPDDLYQVGTVAMVMRSM